MDAQQDELDTSMSDSFVSELFALMDKVEKPAPTAERAAPALPFPITIQFKINHLSTSRLAQSYVLE